MDKEPQFYPKQPETEVPPKAEFLVRNIERRKRLLERISQQLTGRNIEVPEIFIKEKTFFRFLTESYRRIRSKTEQETLDEYGISNLKNADQEIINKINDSTLKRIKDFNKRVFVLINRLSFVSKRKEPTTAIVTALYDRPKKGVDLLADDFPTFLGKVKKLAVLLKEKEIPLESITGMQCRLGIPDPEKLEKFIDFINENKVNGKEIPLESITGMQMGLGIPNLEDLKKFIDFINENKVNGKEIPLESITGMQNGLGIPNLEDLKKFIDFINENKVNGKEISLESITGMQNGLGIPNLEDLKKFIDFINENKVNGKEIPLESITGMQTGLGIPNLKKLKELIDFAKRKNLDIQQFIKQISGKRIGKGIPSIEELEAEYKL